MIRSPARVVVSERPGLRFERSLPAALGGGLYSVQQRIESRGRLERCFVTGRFWLFALVYDESGLSEGRCGEDWVPLPRRRAFVVPPRSLLCLRLSNVRLTAYGVIGRAALPDEVAGIPRVAAVPDGTPQAPRDLTQIARLVAGGMPLDPDRGVGELGRRVRLLLHELAAHPSPVRAAAAALGVSPDTVTRVFRLAYGISPKSYLQRARVSDALLALVAGAGVVRAGLDASFNDVSRFYRVFRRSTGNTPGEYAALHDRKARRRAAPLASF